MFISLLSIPPSSSLSHPFLFLPLIPYSSSPSFSSSQVYTSIARQNIKCICVYLFVGTKNTANGEGSSRCRGIEGFEPSLLHSRRCFTSFHVSCRFSYSRILHPLVQSFHHLHLLLHLLDSPVLSIRQSPFCVSCCGHKWLVLSPSPIIYLPSLRPFVPSVLLSATHPPIHHYSKSFFLPFFSLLNPSFWFLPLLFSWHHMWREEYSHWLPFTLSPSLFSLLNANPCLHLSSSPSFTLIVFHFYLTYHVSFSSEKTKKKTRKTRKERQLHYKV